MKTSRELDILRTARETLMGGAWVKKSPRSAESTYCTISPLFHLPREQMKPIADALHKAARTLFPERTTEENKGAMAVNDHPDTTFNDVMAMYDEAERILKERV